MKRLLTAVLLALSSMLVSAPAAAQTRQAKTARKPVKKEAVVYVTRTGAKYRSEYCRYLRLSSIPVKKRDAVAGGYTACSRCSP